MERAVDDANAIREEYNTLKEVFVEEQNMYVRPSLKWFSLQSMLSITERRLKKLKDSRDSWFDSYQSLVDLEKEA